MYYKTSGPPWAHSNKTDSINDIKFHRDTRPMEQGSSNAVTWMVPEDITKGSKSDTKGDCGMVLCYVPSKTHPGD